MLSTYRRAVCTHESGYRFAANRFGIELRRIALRELHLRRSINEVIVGSYTKDATPARLEALATMMLIGREALLQLAPRTEGRDNDEIEAQNLIFSAFQLRYGLRFAKEPSGLREFRIRVGELQQQAADLVAEHRAEITAITADLLATG
jgi:hypothetical protein